jgi:D-tyrosyl-tRNA(Tyr) deacylase
MIGLLQRVTEARVAVAGRPGVSIGRGLLVFVGIERTDTADHAGRLAKRLMAYRVFPDELGRMNHSVIDIGGSVLLVPQFTLTADTASGNRPSLSRGAEPAAGKRLFEELVHACERLSPSVATGQFGADMQVGLVNDGPVTFWLRVPA